MKQSTLYLVILICLSVLAFAPAALLAQAGDPPPSSGEEIYQRLEEVFHRILARGHLAQPQGHSEAAAGSSLEAVNRALFLEVLPSLEQALVAARRQGHEAGFRAQVHRLRMLRHRVAAVTLLNREAYPEADRLLTAALAEAPDSLLLNQLAYARFHLKDPAGALHFLRQAVDRTRKSRHPNALFAYNLGWVLFQMRHFEAAAASFAQAADWARQAQQPVLEASALINLAVPSLFEGDLNRAERQLEHGARLARQLPSTRLRLLADYNLALMALLRRDAGQLQRRLRRLLWELDSHGDRVFLSAERIQLRRHAVRLRGGATTLFGNQSRGSVRDPGPDHSHAAHLMARFPGSVVLAWPQAQEGASSRVNLGSALAFPQSTTTLPLHWTPASGVAISRLQLEIELPPEISLVRVERAPALETQEVELTSNVRAREEGSLVEIELRAAAEARHRALPEGLLLYVTLSLGEKVHAGGLLLGHRAQAARIDGSPLEDLKFEDTVLTILGDDTAPTMACFYYLH